VALRASAEERRRALEEGLEMGGVHDRRHRSIVRTHVDLGHRDVERLAVGLGRPRRRAL
jgi:hypothetical protein